MSSQRWGIVGGGMLGLTMALRLVEAGHEVTLFESAQQLGGLASSWELGDVVWDRHYHVTLMSDSALRSVLQEIGLDREIEWAQTRAASFSNGELYPVSNIVEFLRFPLLRFVNRIRLGGTIWYGAKVRNWRRLEQISVEKWLRRWSGSRVFERFWLPLLRSKLGYDYRRTAASFIWATIQRLYKARRSGLKKEMFGYVPGGYARVLERFGAVLMERGVTIRLGASVKAVEASGIGPLVQCDGSDSEQFDHVVVTAPAPVAARIIRGLPQAERALLGGIEYQGIVCASLLLRRPLGGFYLTYITDPAPFTAVVEMTALVDRKYLKGHTLVYLPTYVSSDSALFDVPDDEIREEFVGALMSMDYGVDPDDVLAFRVSRVRHVFALPTLGYSSRIPSVFTGVPGVYVVNSAQIVNGTLNVNETIELAESAVTRLTDVARAGGRLEGGGS